MTMAGTQVSPLRMKAGEALAINRFVKLDGSTERQVVYADAGDRPIGVTLAPADSGAEVAVEMLNVGATLKVTAAGTITVNSTVYTANDGKVSDSVSGQPIGKLLKAGAAGEPTEMAPFGQAGGDLDRSTWVVFNDDFLFPNTDESGSEGMWLLDANDGGALAQLDAHAGVITLTASDTTVGDNDETYLVSVAEIYKPAIGVYDGEILGIAKARIKFTEANTDDAGVIFLLLGGDTTDVADTIADGGASIANANQYIGFFKADGGTVYQGVLRDTAQDSDTDVGTRVSGSFQELKMVIYDADITDGEVEVGFYLDGVLGGTLAYAVSGATEMRFVVGVKNGGANLETLHVDRVYFEFKRA